jgi:hypothetical protein
MKPLLFGIAALVVKTRPLIVIYVTWHPEFAEGKAIADMLHDHYRRNLLTNVSGARASASCSVGARARLGCPARDRSRRCRIASNAPAREGPN